MNASNIFSKVSHAVQYAKFRPSPPHQIIDRILNYLKAKLNPPFGQALDVGCGSGQSTNILAPHFKKVLGVDVSEAQITEALKKETNGNVEYKVGSSDSFPLPDSSTELVSASQAVHWFNLPAFYKETDRVLKPGGILALYCYSFPRPHGQSFSEELLGHIRHMYIVETAGYWHKNRKIVDDNYASIELPYAETVRDSSFFEDNVWSVSDFVGYIKSWSGYQAFLEDKPDEALKTITNFEEKMMKTLNASVPSSEATVNMRWKYTLLMGRKAI